MKLLSTIYDIKLDWIIITDNLSEDNLDFENFLLLLCVFEYIIYMLANVWCVKERKKKFSLLLRKKNFKRSNKNKSYLKLRFMKLWIVIERIK